MEKMATNKTNNKSPVFKMGQLWQTIDDNAAADEEDTEEEDEVKNNETMKLRREDMSLFGVCPAWDQFYLVVCEYCQQVIKPQALQKHIDLRHSYHKNNSNNQINNTLKVRTDSTNITTNAPSIRRTSSTITTATNITENGSDFNDNSIKISDNLVNQLTKSDVKLKSCFNDIVVNSVVDKSVDNCVKRSELSEQQTQKTISEMNSKLINILSPNISTTIEPSVPEPTGPGPGFTTVVSADSDSVTISVPEINLSPQLETIKEIEVTAPVVKPAPKKKTYKKSANPRKLLPCKDREYDPNKHCGVCLPDMERPCTRSLTCKTHSLTLRRSVQGRIKNFDELLTEHREAKEAALRAQGIEVKPTKKAIQKQQQQLRASQQLQLKAEENQQLISDKNISSQPLNPLNRTTIVFSESQTMVSNITTNSNSLLSFVSPPICPTAERTREPVPTPERSHLKLDQIEVESDGSVYMKCHPKPAAVCNFNIRTLDKCRLLSRTNDLTLAALRSTFNSPLLVSKLTNNKKCSSTMSSTPSPIAIKSPLRNANQTFSAKKLRISLDSESFESSSDAAVDPYNFADAMTTTTSANIYTYVKPKTTIAKSATNASKKKKKSDINCTTFNSSLLSNGQLFHSTTKTTGSTAKKKSVVKKNINNSHNTCISADIPLNSVGSDSIDSVVSPYSEQLIDPSTSLISEVPQRNLNDIFSNSMDSSKTDNGSILLNGSLLSCKRNTFSALSKPNIDIKDSINKKTLFTANSLNNNNNRFLINSLSPPLTTISSGLSINANSRPIIQKQTLPSSTVNNNLTQSQNMSQLSQSLHNTTRTIFIKSAKQSLQNQLIPAISSPKLLSKAEDYTT